MNLASWRHGNTATEMKLDGAWAKVGKHHYRHVSGIEVTKPLGQWMVSTQPDVRWSALWVAKHEAERDAAKAGL